MNDALGFPQSLLVLGGGSDIGRAVVRVLATRRLQRLVLGGRPSSSALAAVADEARTLGIPSVVTVAFDATDPPSVASAVDAAFDEHGDIDVVLVAFGVLGDQDACEQDPALATEIATVNYTSAVVAGLAAARRMRGQGHGTIVALSSVAGERVRRANFVYGSTKAGFDGFFQGLGDSLQGSGARVVIVRPGFVHSKMTAGMPAAPMATTPEAVAGIVVAALTRRKETAWAPPLLRPVFAVFRHLPRAVWRRMPA
jgi:decaprenylphospho-beta-D-erythro-pentofuranosid-2-ulose 2-reductase